MVRKTTKRKIAAKVLAAILSVTTGLSTMSSFQAGAVAFAQETTEAELPTEEVLVTEEDEVFVDETTDAASEEAGYADDAAESEYETFEDEDVATEEEAEKASDEEETGNEADTETSDLFGTERDSLVEFTTDSSEKDGIKTTVSKWNFAASKNTGANTAAGDSISGIIVGGVSGKTFLDSGSDINVKDTGAIYLPISNDTNVVTITIAPKDSDKSRYVSVGSADSDVLLIDDKSDAAHQTVTFKADLEDYVVDAAGDVAGRFIPLYSHGNFKTASIELIETDATTVVKVSGSVTGEGVDKVTGLKFKNELTEELYKCEVESGKYSVNLPNGFRYTASVTGTFDYRIDDSEYGNIVDLSTGNDKTCEKNFALVEQNTAEISGALTITRIDNAKDVSSSTLKVTLVPEKKTLDSVELELVKGVDDYNYTYTAVILPNEKYTVELTNANDYECKQEVRITESKAVDLEVTARPLYKVELETVTHNLEKVSAVTALTVKNLDDDYEYSFSNLSGNKLEIEVRDGIYEVTEITTIGNYKPYEHFEVDGEPISEKMYLKDTSEKAKVAYDAELTVGKSGSDYTTIYDALDAVKRMERSEGQRVTIVLNDEFYREQVVVDVPDVTFASGREDGSTISWYYGLGGDSYYSAYLNTGIDKNHLFYDEAHAVDKYESATISQTPGNWGSTVNLKDTATGFKAENITFENSFNFYISDAEKEDIASSGSILDRTVEGADPTLYKSKERACTMYNRGADQIEFYNCSFISSQDTLYTGDKDENSYFYNCLIEGTTDFICGDGNAVFDNCELVLYGFSDQSKSDLVILASKGSATKGYLFNYCTIRADKSDAIKTSTSAYLGRPWGVTTEKVAFMNTILDSDLIQEKGWTTMNTVPSLNTGLHEYRTRLSDGTKVDLSGRVAANIGKDKQGTADNYVLESDEGYGREDYLSAEWRPSYYGADYAEVNEQILRYNALISGAEYAALDADKKAAIEAAFNAIETGLFAADQNKVDTFASNLESTLDAVLGKVAKAPTSNVNSGTYDAGFDVELATETEGASIYYTTDGTEPTAENGTLYTKPVSVTESVTIKAVAVAEGFAGSEVSVFEYVIEKPASKSGIYVFESKDLTAFAASESNKGVSVKAGTDDYFTLIYSEKTKVDTSAKTWEDKYASSQRLNFGGAVSTEKNAVKFTTDYPVTVKVWWVQGGDDNRQMAILNASGDTVAITSGTYTKNDPYFSTLKVDAAGTYYIGGATNNNNIYKIEVEEKRPVVYLFESKDMTAFAASDSNKGVSVKAGTDDYFTLIYSEKTKVDTSAKTWEDKYASSQRLNFGGAVSTEKNAVKFTTSGAATIKIWWVQGGDDNRQMAILDASGNTVAITSGTYTKNDPYFSTLKVDAAGTYYLGGATNNNNIYKIEVTEGSEPVVIPRKDWDLVEEPVVTGVALNAEDAGKIDVTVSSVIGVDGGDKLTAYMLTGNREESEREILATQSYTVQKEEFVFTFAPTASGKYFFAASLSREDSDYTLESSETEDFEFVLPLSVPQFKNAVNMGKGSVKVNYYSVPEATTYVLTATDKTDAAAKPVVFSNKLSAADVNSSTEHTHTFKSLKVDHTYEISLYAERTRGEIVDKSGVSALDVEVKKASETEWVFSAFGDGVTSDKKSVGYTVNDDESVTLWDLNNKGKLVPASTDGLAFYYTAVPANKNFTLTAKATIDTWSFTNGQEGFGLMAADSVGVHGDNTSFWNNSYMATATKVEYYYDRKEGEVTNVDTADKITMKLGLGAQEKTGVTLSNIEGLKAKDPAAVSEFSSKMYPLETSCGDKGVGTYNLFGKESTGTVTGTIDNPLTEITLRIQKNNTGYFVSYLGENGEVLTTKKFYDTKALSKLDSKYVYVGFFTARTFKATFSNISLTLIDPSKDAKAETQDITYVKPNYKVISATWSNTEKYELQYTGNADGVLTITDDKDSALVDAATVKSGAITKVEVRLKKGKNNYTVTFTPNRNYRPGADPYKRLTSYEGVTFKHTVEYATFGTTDNKIYVAPNGTADAAGTADAPVDIYTAVKFVQPGQTISLAAGTYSLNETVIVERGIDGTSSKPIRMVAENGRAIFDFNRECAGFIFVGDYWYVKGIDCTNSGDSEKGIQVSGSHITLEDIRTYKNGNTGIQVSRYLSSDKRADWPSYDLVLNCTSYANADPGNEDADGFAAKLTCGDGIVFDGCISYNNADDGWDLFAKVESGSIGEVTIRNCVAFANGYDVNGNSLGNGNGFKMGGSSMAGAHKLINSVAWNNKTKGIDSNSGPDIQVYNSMSFNNGSNNVALYTNDAANTNYLVEGVLSYRTDGKSTNENIKPRGLQDETRIYGSNNFYWNDGKSVNADGVTVADDWFESLAAPMPSAEDPYAVAASLRTEDGSIDLGSFLKLTEKGAQALAEQGIEQEAVVAEIDGEYEVISDAKDIAGAEADTNQHLKFEVVNFELQLPYTGNKVTQENMEVYYGDTLLRKGVDYTVAYKNNVKVGTATVTVTGKGNYSGKTTETFEIVPANIADAAIVVTAVNETGKEATGKYPAVKATVKYMGKTLTLKKDYTISADWTAEPEINAESGVKYYPVTVKGIGNFADSENTSAKIKVYPKGQKAVTDNNLVNLKSGSVELEAASFDFTGLAIKPVVTVYAGKGANKGEAVDPENYTVKYASNINKGTATVTVTGKDAKGYVGTLTRKFTIKAIDMAAAMESNALTVDMAEPVEYMKGGAKPVPVVKFNGITLRAGVDYKLTYTGNTKVGLTGNKAPKVTIKGAGNFTKSVVKTFAITTKSIKKASVVVTDKAIKKNAKGTYLVSKPVVYDEDGKTLKEKTDYTVKYYYNDAEINKNTVLVEGNTAVKVVVTGTNAFTDNVEAQYQIRELQKLSLTKNDKIADQKYTGSAIRPDSSLKLYTVTGTGKKAVKTYLNRGTDFEIVLCFNNVNTGTATYILRGKGQYSGFKTVTFKIKKASAK